ncbi:MAG: hypothetical protein U5Q03_13320 [Bacteroidota bacterium]|nr:hypothetical protein [Bacteroidota bacterium]
MIIIADKKIPDEARNKLKGMGVLIELQTMDITYDSISGHPDVFFFQAGDKLVVAPNLPQAYKSKLQEMGIDYLSGEMPVGKKYPGTAFYNAVFVDNFLIHNFRYTDSRITQLAADAELIHVNQGYTRCNILPLGNKKFITSDQGIHKTLLRYNMDVLYVNPDEILLPGQKHGFIGGCCGIWKHKLFIIGNLNHFSEGNKIRKYVSETGLDILELYDGPLFDGGVFCLYDKAQRPIRKNNLYNLNFKCIFKNFTRFFVILLP